MTERPGHSAAPREQDAPTLDPSVTNTRWIVVAASIIGVLTVLLVGTTVAVTRSGNTPDDTIEQIESYWKSKLLTRRFGLNAN